MKNKKKKHEDLIDVIVLIFAVILSIAMLYGMYYVLIGSRLK